jgi:hypothetical protein
MAWLHVVRRDAEAADGARVGGENAGDGGFVEVLAGVAPEVDGAVVAEETVAFDVERRGPPEWAPTSGQDLGARGLLGGEEGHVNTTLFSQINYSTSRFTAMDSPGSSYYRGEMN